MSTALFLGRFQPVPHKGHLKVIEEILVAHDKVIIGVGSSQYSDTIENPMTADERAAVLTAVLDDLDIASDQYSIISIPDIHDNDAYVAHVEKLVPAFTHAYSGNELVQRLFHEAGYTVVPITLYGDWSGTRIREQMRTGDTSYRDALPESSLRFVDAWNIEERVDTSH